jgi:hypothetical protein
MGKKMATRYHQGIVVENWGNHKNNKKKGVLSLFKSVCTPGTVSATNFSINIQQQEQQQWDNYALLSENEGYRTEIAQRETNFHLHLYPSPYPHQNLT